MDTKDVVSFFAYILIYIGVSGIFLIGGCGIGIANTRREAIEAGVGRYVIDPTTGVTDFEFVQDCENKDESQPKRPNREK